MLSLVNLIALINAKRPLPELSELDKSGTAFYRMRRRGRELVLMSC